jgi:hypothetical protein
MPRWVSESIHAPIGPALLLDVVEADLHHEPGGTAVPGARTFVCGLVPAPTKAENGESAAISSATELFSLRGHFTTPAYAVGRAG